MFLSVKLSMQYVHSLFLFWIFFGEEINNLTNTTLM